MAAASASERLVSGLTLHRSETIAHRADIFDQKGASRASTRARGRCEGHQSKPNSIFKPLGNPVKNERIVEMNTMKLAKVEKTCAEVVANVSSQHHDQRPKGNGVESATDFSGTMRSKGGDLGKDDKADGTAEAERAQREQLAQQPHGLFGRDLPRCKCHGRRHDGFGMLRDAIIDSEVRLQQVRTDCSGNVRGFDYGSTMIEALLPPRERYPARMPSDLASRSGTTTLELEPPATQESAAGSSPSPSRLSTKRLNNKLMPMPPSEPRPGLHGRPAPPQSARPALAPSFHHHAEHSPEKRVGRQPPHRLQTLDEFIVSSGPAIGVGGRSERSEGLKLREQINELLGIDKNTTLKLPPEEPGGRRGRLDVRRRNEKRMDEAWKDNQSRDFLKKWIAAPKDIPGPVADIERILREEAAANGEAVEEGGGPRAVKLATAERHLRDYPGLSDDRLGNEAERANGVPGGNGEERDATGTAWATEVPETAERRRKRERLDTDDVEASATNYTSVAKLRTALHAYQASREEKRRGLEESLHAMDVNRPNLIRRKLALGTTGASDLKASMTARSEAEACDDHSQKQHVWYRDLLCRVQDDKQNLPRVAHYIFDCIRQVLEYGEEFRREVFFAMMDKIQNFEFTRLIAGLVVNMIKGIDGVTSQDLIAWFEQNRGEVPPAILELLERRAAPPQPPPPARLSMQPKVGRTLTFVTELP